jgi:folate-binding protein YgfZ
MVPAEIKIPQYAAVREHGAGLIDLSARGRIRVSGSEAVMFLNGLITNDMKTLAVNSWMPAAFPNVQGRLLAAVRILHRDDGYLIDTEGVTREKVVAMLDRFTLAGDFKVADVTNQTASFSIQGPKAAVVMTAIFGDGIRTCARDQVVRAEFEGVTVSVIRATHTGEDGFDLFIDADAGQRLSDRLTAEGAKPIDNAVAETLRIEAGIPCYGVDMDETTIVTETNLDDAVSFTKGCYLGQEIIVRIKHRGHVAKKLCGLILDSSAEVKAGAKILSTETKEIGRVTSTTFSPRLERPIALGYVKYDYLTPGTGIRVITQDGEIDGQVSALPIVRGSWNKLAMSYD